MKYKCRICLGCLEIKQIGNKLYRYCFLCEKYYKIVEHKLVEVSKDEVDRESAESV